jgi:DNA-binding GntR family transcriptional regulator
LKITQRQKAYEYIRERITGGAIATGERVSASALAREIGVSHIPVREAISQLQSEGLIVHRAHQGAFVKGANREELVDVIEVRTLLESHAAASAARNASARQIEELDERWKAICVSAEGITRADLAGIQDALKQFLNADLEFHMTILRSAGNRRAIQVIQDLRVMTYMFGYRNDDPLLMSDPAAFVARNLRVHGDIYEAVRRRDAKAAKKAMAIHMRQAGKTVLARFDRLTRGDLQDEAAPPVAPAKLSALSN